MDPIVLALAGRVVGLFKPLVLAGADELKRTVGVRVVDRLTGLLQTIRDDWAGDSEATEAIDGFQKDPEAGEAGLTDILARRMETDPELAAAINREIQAIGPRLMITMQGGHVVEQEGPEVGDIRRGTVDVRMSVEEAERQKAGKYGDIG